MCLIKIDTREIENFYMYILCGIITVFELMSTRKQAEEENYIIVNNPKKYS